MVGSVSGTFAALRKTQFMGRYRWITVAVLAALAVSFSFWITSPKANSDADIASHYSYAPQQRNSFPSVLREACFPGALCGRTIQKRQSGAVTSNRAQISGEWILMLISR